MSSAFIDLITSCLQDVECLPAYSTTSDSWAEASDKCMQLEGSPTPPAAVWAEVVHNKQVPLSVFMCCTSAARLNPKSVRAHGAVLLLKALIYQCTFIPDPSSSLLASIQQQLQASGLLPQLATLMQAACGQLAQSAAAAHSSSEQGGSGLRHAHCLLWSFLHLWKKLQPPGISSPLSFAAHLLPAVMQLVQAVQQRIGVEAQREEPKADIDALCPIIRQVFWIVLSLMSDICDEAAGQMPSVLGLLGVQLLTDTLAPLASVIAMTSLEGALRAGGAMPSSGACSSTSTSSDSSSTAQHAGNSNTRALEGAAGTGAAQRGEVSTQTIQAQQKQADMRAAQAFDRCCTLLPSVVPSYQQLCDAIGADGRALVVGALAMPQRSQVMDATSFLITMWKKYNRYLLQQIATQAAPQLLPGQQAQLRQNLTLRLQLCTFLLECAASGPTSHPDFPSRCSLAADLIDGHLLYLSATVTAGDPWLQSYPPAEWTDSVLPLLQQLSAPLLQHAESSQAVAPSATAATAGSAAPAAEDGPATNPGPSSTVLSGTATGAGRSGTQGSSAAGGASVRDVFTALNAVSLLVGAHCRVLYAAADCDSAGGPSAAGAATVRGAQQQVASASDRVVRHLMPALQIKEQYVRLVTRCPRSAFRTPTFGDFNVPQQAVDQMLEVFEESSVADVACAAGPGSRQQQQLTCLMISLLKLAAGGPWQDTSSAVPFCTATTAARILDALMPPAAAVQQLAAHLSRQETMSHHRPARAAQLSAQGPSQQLGSPVADSAAGQHSCCQWPC